MRFVTVSLSCLQREMERERAAAARLAFDANEAAMTAHHVIDDGKAQAGPLWTRPGVGLDAVELPEDFTLQARRDADAVIGNPDHAVSGFAIDLDQNLAMLWRILHRVRDQ